MQSYIFFFLHIFFCFHFPKLVFPCVHTLNISTRQRQKVCYLIFEKCPKLPQLYRKLQCWCDIMQVKIYSIFSIFLILTYWYIFNHNVDCSAFGEAESLVLEKTALVEEMDTLNRLAWTIFLSLSLRCTPWTVDVYDDGQETCWDEKNRFSEFSNCRSYLLGLNDLETRREALNEAEAAKEVGAKVLLDHYQPNHIDKDFASRWCCSSWRLPTHQIEQDLTAWPRDDHRQQK